MHWAEVGFAIAGLVPQPMPSDVLHGQLSICPRPILLVPLVWAPRARLALWLVAPVILAAVLARWELQMSLPSVAAGLKFSAWFPLALWYYRGLRIGRTKSESPLRDRMLSLSKTVQWLICADVYTGSFFVSSLLTTSEMRQQAAVERVLI